MVSDNRGTGDIKAEEDTEGTLGENKKPPENRGGGGQTD
jgi:hypothetical protein